MTFCVTSNVHVLKPSIQNVCTFLKQLESQGLGYRALNTARSSLATILPSFEGYEVGKHPIVCWMLKGAYEKHPPQPKYTAFWDVNKVFELVKSWGKNLELSLRLLSFKVTVLLLLVTSQRGQTILSLSVKGLDLEDMAVFRLDKLLKHNRLGDALDTIIIKPFEACRKLCAVRAIKAYVKATKEVRRANEQLLISFQPPHRPISRDTLARWTLQVLSMAGIDIQKYQGHSTRGA